MKTFLIHHKMSSLLPSFSLLFFSSCLLNTFVSPTQHLCHSDHSEALLEFKTEFGIKNRTWVASYPKTESWKNNSNCCSWDGITCDISSGKVIGLDLYASYLHGRLESNNSLFRLRHLRDLNLAYNNFTGSPIPAEFNQLKELERLNLSKSSFSGQIPTKFLQLTKLVSLDLSSNSLSIEGSFLPLLVRNLRNLRELDMSFVDISSEIPHELSSMWSLRVIRLVYCNLLGEFPNSVFLIPNLKSIILDDNSNLRGSLPVFHGNNSIKILSLHETSFSGNIPDSISNLKHLTSLTFGSSLFSGKIPSSLGNLSSLSSLYLSGNDFSGEIPSSIGNLKHLSYFYVSGNKLSGDFPSALLNLTQLRSIDLGSNQFTGLLPLNISHLPLEYFTVSQNSFTGVVPSSLFMIPSLKSISMESNQFSGLAGIENIPRLLDLQVLNLGDNKFMGSPVDLNIFSPLKKLERLVLSSLPLTASNNLAFSSEELRELDLSGCNLTEFPEFIRNQRNLNTLFLSNNKIKGQVPYWLWRQPKLGFVDLSLNSFTGFKGSLMALPDSKIYLLDLSSNAFQGTLLIPPRFIRFFSASKNNFTGEIPRLICRLTSLEMLYLSDNNLNGSIPWCLKNQMSSLEDLNLHNNNFSGNLPDIFINAKSLKSLDVSHNRLEGNLPPSITGCSALQVLNVGSNKINGMFPFKLNSLEKLQVLILRSNKFNGTLHNVNGGWFGFPQLNIIDVSHNDFFGTLPNDYFLNWTAIFSTRDNSTEPEYIWGGNTLDLNIKGVSLKMERILTIYTAIDFSGNRLQGKIPESIGLLKGLRILNLSRNAFTDHIPSSLANLTVLESLDISQNNISGQISPELGTLSSLAWINVSHNQLSTVDLSNNSLPDSKILFLDLSSNAFQGTLLIPSRFIEYFSASKNNFTGEIPRSICRLASPIMLDLSYNNLHGSIPWCLKNQMSSLQDLNLQYNNFSGSLPDIFINAESLKSLDVSHNQLEGKLPPSLTGCSALQVLNVGSNKINDMFPFKLNSLEKLQVLVLHSNKFHGTLHNVDGGWFGFPRLNIIDVSHNDFVGTLPNDYFLNWTAISSTRDNSTKLEYIWGGNGYYTLDLNIKGVSLKMERILTIYTAIDFSENRLQGKIPDSIGLLKGLRILNLARNAFTDHIPSTLVNLKVLESLDISQNNISGQIPSELGTLSSLAWINVSHNQLEGPIPQGTQFQRQNCSSYEGNPGLSLPVFCGDNLKKSDQFEGPMSEEEEEEEEEAISWKAACLGFVPGVVFGLTIGYKFMKTFGRNKK